MFTARISSQKIDRPRIDPEFYSPEKLEALKWLDVWRDRLVSLEQLSPKITDGTHVTPDYVPTGIRFLSSTNINCCTIDFQKTQLISQLAHQELARSNCNPEHGDLLISKNGKIGTAAQYLESHPPCSCFVSVALVRKPERIDRDYLAMFLNSKGGWSQFSRASKTGVITNLHLEEIREVEVVNCDPKTQQYIGDKVRLADRLRIKGNEWNILAVSLLELLLRKEVSEEKVLDLLKCGNDLLKQLSATIMLFNQNDGYGDKGATRKSRVVFRDMTERLDAGFYRPDFLRNAKELASCGLRLQQIDALCEKCNCGATPVDVEYEQDGQGLIRTSDVRPNRFNDKTVMRTRRLNVDCDSPLAALAGDFLYTMSGTIGYAAVIPETTEIFSFSNTIARARIAPPNNPWFVAAFFNSSMGYKQSLRLTSGGIQGHVMPNPFKRLWVPLPDPRIQDFIGGKLQVADTVSRLSKRLVASAKLLVEALIERNVTENELIHAQMRLEQGDESADRAILSRLFEGGLDATETRPLFPDLDAYYQTLQMVERETVEVTAK